MQYYYQLVETFRLGLNLSDSPNDQMLTDQLRRIDKAHLHIARNMLLVGCFVALAKVAGAAREIAIAREYGVAELVDQYVLVSTFVLLLPSVWTSVAVSVLVPVSRRLDKPQKLAFHAQLTSVICVMSVALCVAAFFLLPKLLFAFYPDMSSSDTETLRVFAQGLSPMIGGGMLIGLLSAQLLTLEHHSNTLYEGIPAIFVLFFVLLWPVSGQPEPLIIGSVLGVFMHVAALVWLLRRSSNAVAPHFKMDSPAWQGFKAAIGIMVFGKIIMSFIAPVEQYIASGLGEGSIATLNYANRLLALFLGLGATAIGRAILPVLSAPDTHNDRARRLSLQWAGILFIFGLILALLGWYLSHIGVRILFERGAFHAEDTNRVARVVQLAVCQLPLFFSGIVLVQFFASAGRYWVLFVTSVIALVVKTVSSIVFAKSLGVAGIALGTTAMYLVNCSILLFLMLRRTDVHE